MPLQWMAAALPFKWIIWFPSASAMGQVKVHTMVGGLVVAARAAPACPADGSAWSCRGGAERVAQRLASAAPHDERDTLRERGIAYHLQKAVERIDVTRLAISFRSDRQHDIQRCQRCSTAIGRGGHFHQRVGIAQAGVIDRQQGNAVSREPVDVIKACAKVETGKKRQLAVKAHERPLGIAGPRHELLRQFGYR